MSTTCPSSGLDPLPRLIDGPAPAVEWLSPEELPAQERALIAHDHDMTPTLEAWADEAIGLHRVTGFEENHCVYREVFLIRAATGTRLLYGAIRIHLDRLPDSVADQVREHRIPLGRLLADAGVAHDSHPDGFFRIQGFEAVEVAWPHAKGNWCHGRRNTLRHADGSLLAEVVEIVPPLS